MPSSSAPLAESITPATPPDFSITPTGSTSQTLTTAGFVSYPLSVQMVAGGPSSPVNLSVSGLPAFTRATFTPAYLPPGSTTPVPVTLTITSESTSAANRAEPGSFIAWSASVPLLFLLIRKQRRLPNLALSLILLSITGVLTGCGDRINTAGQHASSVQTYTLTVTGTATAGDGSPLQHTATLVLNMTSSQ